MSEFFLSRHWHEIMIIGVLFFSLLYFLVGGINILLSRVVLPFFSYGKILDHRPLQAGQVRRELLFSLLSILIFGTGLIFPWWLLQWGWAKFAVNPQFLQITIEIIVLIIWNEIHFYINHRLLHTAWLKRFHLPHHRSVVTTPWASYSFHPIEAIMLGNVILLPMCLHDFSFIALASVPIFSIIFNNIGHSNYDFLPDAHKDRWWLNGARRHHLHHACYQGNFGFMFPFMDRACTTALAPDAADQRLATIKKTHVA